MSDNPDKDETKQNLGRIGPVHWRKFEKVLLKLGCEFVSQKRTSHRKYRKPGVLRPIVVPVHTKEIDAFFIRNNLQTLGVSREDYLKALAEV